MVTFGLKLMSELRAGSELVRHAVVAEERGLEFLSISDHIHPWLPEHEHSSFAWSVMGAIAARTERIEIVTGVTCPLFRYHPVIIAQAAATVAELSGGRFTLGLGAGERLNEHVTGAEFPSADLRHERLREAVDIMKQLWSGEYTTVRGRFYDADHVKIYEHLGQQIPIVLAVSGEQSLDLAADTGCDGIMATEPEAPLVDGWTSRGGSATDTWTEAPLAWEPTAERGVETAKRFRFGQMGWDVAAELPNPAHFAAATQFMTDDQIDSMIPNGPDPEPYVTAVQEFIDAGFSRIAIVPVGDDLEGTLDFWEDEVRPQLALGD
ncbi:TIGR03557 family F420-dependent LLM class oxidoreductase [Ilumatobacter sp.]|uniref:TIGR03557 family F420-dependent LLM class oxidoreductase n=1 Tax=Ilumatobacter sp. TaxID=1967498 RepID=UPI003B52D42F